METAPCARELLEPEPTLGLLGDERLATLVRETGHQLARDELIARTSRQRVDLVRRLARDTGLNDADRADVLQEAVFWTLEAIQHYQGQARAAAGGCSFRSFLHRVIACRFIDFLRHRHRYHRHFVHIGGTLSADLDRFFNPTRPGGAHPEVNGHPQEFDEGETSVRLERHLDRLGVRTRRLWELLTRGATVVEISAVFQISYDAAKRRRRRLIIQLRKSVRADR
ncbi:MAG TPA: sigma-70 family RNA polymerase sigma factor [Fimbriiglobus sp.]|nr:sigma-70 family RNA polymerase sigma factor [Fimbriiglobus sp.]